MPLHKLFLSNLPKEIINQHNDKPDANVQDEDKDENNNNKIKEEEKSVSSSSDDDDEKSSVSQPSFK